MLTYIQTMNKHLQTIVDGLLAKANEQNVELIIENTFDDKYKHGKSFIVHNTETMKFGVVSCDVKEFPDEPVVFFEFNDKLYNYAKMEGFAKDDMVEKFDNKVLKKLTRKQFVNYIISAQL